MRISDWSSDVCSSDLAGFEQRGGCGFVVDAGRQPEQRRCGNEPRRRIGIALRPEGRDAVAGLEAVNVGADGDHLAGGFDAQPAGQLDRISAVAVIDVEIRSEEHTSELQSLMRISYAVFCLKKKTKYIEQQQSK